LLKYVSVCLLQMKCEILKVMGKKPVTLLKLVSVEILKFKIIL